MCKYVLYINRKEFYRAFCLFLCCIKTHAEVMVKSQVCPQFVQVWIYFIYLYKILDNKCKTSLIRHLQKYNSHATHLYNTVSSSFMTFFVYFMLEVFLLYFIPRRDTHTHLHFSKHLHTRAMLCTVYIFESGTLQSYGDAITYIIPRLTTSIKSNNRSNWIIYGCILYPF